VTPRAARGLRFALICLGLSGAAAGCASGQSECRADTWSGTCHLLSVAKVRESEFPLPNVVLEGVYRPQPNPGGPPVVPGDTRREYGALTKYEDALRAHIQAYPKVRCYVNPPTPGQCQPGPLVVEIPEFNAATAQASSADSGPQGCAQIDAASSQDKITQNRATSRVIQEHFEFAESSAELPATAAATLDGIAARLKQAPEVQCVGVVGAWVRGENVAMAFARARAVREQLIARGIAPERMLALTTDPPPIGNSGIPEPPKPTDRKVTLSVLLEFAPNR
jgi:outer membrane protein OmpA-like peptidoglycan-associated protein